MGGVSAGVAGNYSYRNIKGVVQNRQCWINGFYAVGFTRNIGKTTPGVNGTAANDRPRSFNNILHQ